jgi:hypothetical protein
MWPIPYQLSGDYAALLAHLDMPAKPQKAISVLRGNDKQYEREGYRIFTNGLNAAAVQWTIAAIRNEVLTHKGPLLRHPTGKSEPHDFVEIDGSPGRRYIRNPLLSPHQATASLPETSAALLDLLCSAELGRCLRELDGASEYTIHQVILFFVGPCMDTHVDGWFFDTVPHGGAHTVWIPLEEINIRNGPTCIFPWPRRQFLNGKALGLKDLFTADKSDLSGYHQYQRAIVDRARSQRSGMVLPQMKPGDFAVWSSLTPHGTLPAAAEGTSRLSMQVLIRPTDMRWGTLRDIEFDKTPSDDPGRFIREGWREKV